MPRSRPRKRSVAVRLGSIPKPLPLPLPRPASQIHPSLERVLGARLAYPYIQTLLQRHGSPARLKKLGRDRCEALLKAHGSHKAHHLTTEIFDTLAEQTLVAPRSAPHSEHPRRREQHPEELRNPSSQPQLRKTGLRHPPSAVISSLRALG
ncbi:hypothetical protein OG568_61070 (plasmid) [Streptomyces sp. NBC_01450]|uniref:hypothetical protein n=1 Tax=Streptomyces sp. NBC_01450 TaxID=2903871 RepID=UPI002E302026|nr:hypothetical protein [Streptomyces sp. NBC_01450]